MWRSIASNALTLFILVLIVFAGLLAWGQRAYTAAGPLSSAICFEVQKGASLSTVSRALAERGAISDPRIFRIGAEYSGRSKELKFGSYRIEAGSSMENVLAELTASGQSTCGREVNFRIGVNSLQVVLRELDPTSNRYEDVLKFDPAADAAPSDYLEARDAPDLRWRITLAEGVTSWNVVEALRRADFLAGEVLEVPPEGALAPDSYEVTPGLPRAELLAEMARRQEATLQELWASRAEGLPYASPQDALIMASIVEKETGVAEERKLVASVFLNRLAKGMRLQTDPTVIYGITKGQGVLGRGLRQSELARETPYNTYVVDGMPPTPIANPGRSSIEAALDPALTDYIFFVADGTGGHAFAATLDEHNRNVAKWRAIEAEQKNSESEATGEGGGG